MSKTLVLILSSSVFTALKVWVENAPHGLMCFNTLSAVGNSLWEACGTFGRWGLPRGSELWREVALWFIVWPQLPIQFLLPVLGVCEVRGHSGRSPTSTTNRAGNTRPSPPWSANLQVVSKRRLSCLKSLPVRYLLAAKRKRTIFLGPMPSVNSMVTVLSVIKKNVSF